MIPNIDEIVDFCIKEMIDSFSSEGRCDDLCSVNCRPVKAIEQRYGLSNQEASRVYSPMFWSMTLSKRVPIKDIDGTVYFSQTYTSPIDSCWRSDHETEWFIKPEYKDSMAVKSYIFKEQIKKEYGEYISLLFMKFSQANNGKEHPVEYEVA